MLLDDPLQNIRLAGMVPNPVWVDDSYRAVCANAEAVGFRAPKMSLSAQVDLFGSPLQVIPRSKSRFSRTAFCSGLICAKKDMAPFLSDLEF